VIEGADRSGDAHLVLPGPPTPSGWCAHVPGGADCSVSNPVSKKQALSLLPIDVAAVLDPITATSRTSSGDDGEQRKRFDVKLLRRPGADQSGALIWAA